MAFGVGFLFGFYLIAFLLLIVVCVVCYAIDSVVKMKVFRLFGVCEPIMAWIPFVRTYFLGKCCNGRDGQNAGIFNISWSNMLWNLGWLLPQALLLVGTLFRVYSIFYTAATIFNMLYGWSIYSFLYSRLEGRPEYEVRVLSIVTWLLGIIFPIKVLGGGYDKVYSLPNDMYPMEKQGPGWGSSDFDGGYGAYYGQD